MYYKIDLGDQGAYIVIVTSMKNDLPDETRNLASILPSLEGFDWDEGNRDKNLKHDVEQVEIEQVFFDARLLILPDIKHSVEESRFIAYGTTKGDRVLTIVFTLREKKIRPISARDANRKERLRYEEET